MITPVRTGVGAECELLGEIRGSLLTEAGDGERLAAEFVTPPGSARRSDDEDRLVAVRR